MTAAKNPRFHPHDIAYWNPGDRTIRPDQGYVADAFEALLTGAVTEFLREHTGHRRAVRRGLAGPPRGPVVGVAGGELGDLKGALAKLDRRGFLVDLETDTSTHPHGAKEGFVWNPLLVEPRGTHYTERIHGPFRGRRTGRKGLVDMPPKYLHGRRVRSKATGRAPLELTLHSYPSAGLNADEVAETMTEVADLLAGIVGPVRVGGDWNFAWDSKHAAPLKRDSLLDWDVSHEEWGPVGTFRNASGEVTPIDWAMWRERKMWRPQRQVVIDMPGQERGKGGEHYALVIETSLSVRKDWVLS